MCKYIFAILFICSCSQQIYLKNNSGSVFKQCVTPDIYIISPKFSDKQVSAIKSGFDHWNKSLNKKMFVYGGTVELNPVPISLIYIDKEYFIYDISPDRSVRSMLKFLESGCLVGARITIKDSYFINDYNIFETIIRHSVGNLLGLANQVKPGTLMDYRIQKESQHPIDANNDEINAIKNLYR